MTRPGTRTTRGTARGPTSTLIREWIEPELTALDHDEPISRADALRALAGVRAVGRPGTRRPGPRPD